MALARPMGGESWRATIANWSRSVGSFRWRSPSRFPAALRGPSNARKRRGAPVELARGRERERGRCALAPARTSSLLIIVIDAHETVNRFTADRERLLAHSDRELARERVLSRSVAPPEKCRRCRPRAVLSRSRARVVSRLPSSRVACRVVAPCSFDALSRNRVFVDLAQLRATLLDFARLLAAVPSLETVQRSRTRFDVHAGRRGSLNCSRSSAADIPGCSRLEQNRA